MMDIEGIRKHLPHRYPFLFVDRVVALEPGVSIEAYKNLSINEPYFDGHFPGNPVFPGVLLVEAMAQAAGILGFVTMGKTPEDGSIYYLVGTDKLRFKRPCVPGDCVKLKPPSSVRNAVSGSLMFVPQSMGKQRLQPRFCVPTDKR